MATLGKAEELALIARCVAFDDHRAYGRLVDAWQPALLRYLRSLTGDVWLADDIAQEAFVKAYESLSTFRGAARFGTWLFTIATRLFLDFARRPGRSEAPLETVADFGGGIASGFDARHDVAVALKGLDPVDRSIVLLRYLRDLPIGRVAKMVEMTPGAVRVRLHRAKQKMRFILENS